MWFSWLFSLAAAVIVAGFVVVMRWWSPWVAQRRAPCHHRLVKDHGKVVRVVAGVTTASGLDFELVPEDHFDRRAKATGEVHEGQVGMRRFDDAFFLLSDHPRVLDVLKADAVLLDQLHDLLRKAPKRFDFERLACHRHRLRVDYALPDRPEHVDAGPLAAWLAPRLENLARRMGTGLGGKWMLDGVRLRATLLAAVSFGLLAGAVLRLVLLHYFADGILLLAWWPIVAVAAVLGTATAWLLLKAARIAMRGTSRAYRTRKDVGLALGLAAFLLAVPAARDLNVVADGGPYRVVPATVNGHRHTQWRSRHRYHLQVIPTGGVLAPQWLQVSKAEFDDYADGDAVEVDLHAGLLNAPWIGGLAPAPSPPRRQES
jgi:hypothetical protein